jgi:hypothetical protein
MTYYSQYLDLKEEWRESGCGPVSLLMLMELLGGENLPSPNELYQAGLDVDGYLNGIGWKHGSLAELARKYGFSNSQAVDLAKRSGENGEIIPLEEALNGLKGALEKGPVLVSVYRYYDPNRGGHLIVLISLDEEKVVIIDPREKGEQVWPLVDFLNRWKQRFIIVTK